MIQIDTRTGQYLCAGCEQAFDAEEQMRQHQMNCPVTVPTTYTCSRSGAPFETKEDLRDHEHSHEGVYL